MRYEWRRVWVYDLRVLALYTWAYLIYHLSDINDKSGTFQEGVLSKIKLHGANVLRKLLCQKI